MNCFLCHKTAERERVALIDEAGNEPVTLCEPCFQSRCPHRQVGHSRYLGTSCLVCGKRMKTKVDI